MGILKYSRDAVAVYLDDRTLAHLHIVMAAKLRDGSSFVVTGLASLARNARDAVVIEPRTPLQLTYTEKVDLSLNPRWLDAIRAASSKSLGIVLVSEPA
jgi:hypothetical protein